MRAINVAMLSICSGIVVLGLKYLAYWLTGSVALYSDALESIINVAAALAAYIALWIAYQPADPNHPYGHTKAEYFSAIVEGTLIALAALAIIHAAWQRLFNPIAITEAGLGMLVSCVASTINAGLAVYMLHVSKQLRSPAIRADGLHILSDVYTSVGVLVGVGLAWLSGWWIVDPLLALAVAFNILWMGWQLLRESVGGLMDEGLTSEELLPLHKIISAEMGDALQAHDIKTRHAGTITFIQLHLVVPAQMTVQDAHSICNRIETAIQTAIHGAEITIHIEPESEALHTGFVLDKLMH